MKRILIILISVCMFLSGCVTKEQQPESKKQVNNKVQSNTAQQQSDTANSQDDTKKQQTTDKKIQSDIKDKQADNSENQTETNNNQKDNTEDKKNASDSKENQADTKEQQVNNANDITDDNGQLSENNKNQTNSDKQVINCNNNQTDNNGKSSDKNQTNKQQNQVNNEKQQVKTGKTFFDNIPDLYVYSMGMGAWGTYLQIENDGTFTGKYFDKDVANTGDRYKEGTVYLCNFSGKFSDVKKIDEFTYTMKVNNLKTEKEAGKEYIEGDIRYISSKPYGLENADVIYVYLPGKNTSSLDIDYFMWDKSAKNSPKLNHYSIYNPEDKAVFVESDQ